MRGSVPWPVVVLLCVAVWAATRACSETAAPGAADVATKPATVPRTSGAARRATTTPADVRDDDESERPASGSGQPVVLPPGEEPAVVWLTVEALVLSADGHPVKGADVHALPAGAAGTDERSEVSWATTDDAGHAALALPGPGPWDIAAVSGPLVGRANDLTPLRGTPVTLHLERAAVLEIVLDPSLAGRAVAGHGPPFKLRRDSAPEVIERLFPGRGEVPLLRLPWGPLADEAPVLARVPESVPILIRAEHGYEASPRVTTAPGKVVVRRDERPRIAWRFESSTAAPPGRAARAVVELCWIRTADSFAQKVVVLAGGENPPQGTQPAGSVTVDANESGTVTWSGTGIESGRMKWTAAAAGGEPLVLPLVVKTWEPVEEPRTCVVRARFEGVAAGERVEWHVAGTDGENRAGWDAGDPPSSLTWDLEPLVVRGMTAWRVAREVQLGANAEHDVTLVFEPAGRVSVALDGAPPASVSGVFVRRADRTPLAHIDGSSPSHTTSLNCANGALLGPFLPGDVDLEFVATGVVVARRRVTVVAGRTIPLVVAVAAAR